MLGLVLRDRPICGEQVLFCRGALASCFGGALVRVSLGLMAFGFMGFLAGIIA